MSNVAKVASAQPSAPLYEYFGERTRMEWDGLTSAGNRVGHWATDISFLLSDDVDTKQTNKMFSLSLFI